jgi:DNA repair protein RecN (Recombination protein N)
MLTRLRVKNYALIEDLDLSFREGLNVLTGATGAGKSILIDSMNLILGEKASVEMIRSGEEEAFVEATFEFDNQVPGAVGGLLLEQEGRSLLLRRQVSREGRSHSFANDKQVTLTTMREIGDQLADLLGQHHHQSLLDPKIHLELLDRFSLEGSMLQDYQKRFSLLRKRELELKETLHKEQISNDRRELYRFQREEIEKADLKPEEEESLREERGVLVNAQKILSTVEAIKRALCEEEDSVLDRLKVLLREFESLTTLDSRLKEKLPPWQETIFSLEDLASELVQYGESIDADPQRLEWVEDRLRLYADLGKKYGKGYNAIIAHRDKIEEQLQSLEKLQDRIEDLKEEISGLKAEVLDLGRQISAGRRKGTSALRSGVEEELKELGMKGTKFEVRFVPLSISASSVRVSKEKEEIFAGENGLEEVEFQISPNPGEPLKPLAKIASGGEMSRIMLALKTVLAKVDSIPLLIFDEVDVGIGGEVASLVGKKLKRLSEDHQVVCITHLQQIASCGDSHFRVYKTGKGRRTVTEVKRLSQKERVEEIARMISGEEITDLSLKHARQLLSEASETAEGKQ